MCRRDASVVNGYYRVGIEVGSCEVDTLQDRANGVEDQSKRVHDEDQRVSLLAPSQEEEHQEQGDGCAYLRGPIDGNSDPKVSQPINLIHGSGKGRAIGRVQEELLRVNILRTRKWVRHGVERIGDSVDAVDR